MGWVPALLSTEHGLRVISHPAALERDPLLPGFEAFPVRSVFDGELIAFSEDRPDFVALCDRMLLRTDQRVPIAFVTFDVLSLEGTDTMREPSASAASCSETSVFAGPHWSVRPRSLTARPSWQVVEDQELEGLVAKPLGSIYKPGERIWLR